MHNVNRNRANAQEQARRRHGSLWEDELPFSATSAPQSVDLNHANWQQLSAIDGIGEQTARELIAQRTLHGHFLSWEDVRRRVKSLDDAGMEELQQAARIGSPQH